MVIQPELDRECPLELLAEQRSGDSTGWIHCKPDSQSITVHDRSHRDGSTECGDDWYHRESFYSKCRQLAEWFGKHAPNVNRVSEAVPEHRDESRRYPLCKLDSECRLGLR